MIRLSLRTTHSSKTLASSTQSRHLTSCTDRNSLNLEASCSTIRTHGQAAPAGHVVMTWVLLAAVEDELLDAVK
jgi:hypothetical protein